MGEFLSKESLGSRWNRGESTGLCLGPIPIPFPTCSLSIFHLSSTSFNYGWHWGSGGLPQVRKQKFTSLGEASETATPANCSGLSVVVKMKTAAFSWVGFGTVFIDR